MAKTVDELLREIEMEKNAADKETDESKEVSEPTTSDLSETISKILSTPEKKTSPKGEESESSESGSASESSEVSGSEKSSCVKSASALEAIEQLAEEVKEAQMDELIKEAQLLGAAMVDGMMLREQQWAEAGAFDTDPTVKLASELENDPVAYAAFMKGAEDAEAEIQIEKLAEYLESDPEAYLAFVKGAEDAARETGESEDESESKSEDESESESESKEESLEESEKNASDIIRYMLENDPEAAAAFEKGASDAMIENELMDKIANDPEAAAAFNEGIEDAIAEKIASDPELLDEVIKEASNDPLALSGLYLGSPEIPLEKKAEILEAAYEEAINRGDYEAVGDLNKIAYDLANQKTASDVFVASEYVMDNVLSELLNS